MNNLKKIIISLLVLFLFFSLTARLRAKDNEEAVVLEVTRVLEAPDFGDSGPAEILFTIHSGKNRGDTIIHQLHQWGHEDYDKLLKVGKKFLGTLQYKNGKIQRLILGQQRRDYHIIVLFIVVSLLLFAVGRWEGLAGLAATIFTVGLLLYFLFPFIFVGKLILPAGIFICLVTIVTTVLLIMRNARATLPVISSLCLVSIVLFLLSILGLDFLHLDASLARNSRLILTRIHTEAGIQAEELWKLITVGIVISTLGAAMDVAVVIGSTIDEITRDQSRVNLKKAYNSGMKVGSEILSTMINTLIFAYLGLAFPLLLALHVFDLSWLRFINYNFVGIEILRVFVGLTGLALIIPITSFFTAWWCNRK
ncbi:MAG: YibE/F family protein [bacterium]